MFRIGDYFAVKELSDKALISLRSGLFECCNSQPIGSFCELVDFVLSEPAHPRAVNAVAIVCHSRAKNLIYENCFCVLLTAQPDLAILMLQKQFPQRNEQPKLTKAFDDTIGATSRDPCHSRSTISFPDIMAAMIRGSG